MPIQVNSHKDRRILHLMFTDPWGLSDLRPMSDMVRMYLDQAGQPTHRLLNLSKPRTIPPGILLQFKDSLALNHPKNGEFAVVFGTPPVQTFAELAFRLAHYSRVRFFSTEDAAWTYLQSVIAAEDDLARTDSSK